MVTQLPVRIEFSLPQGWRPVDPDKAGAPGSAFVAVHPRPDDGFTANITVAGNYRPDDATLDSIADESVERMRVALGPVRMRDRNEVGPPDAPGLTQILDIDSEVSGQRRELVQTQVYLSFQDVHDPAKRAVLELAMTCTSAQRDTVLEEFQEFVRTVRPAQEDAT